LVTAGVGAAERTDLPVDSKARLSKSDLRSMAGDYLKVSRASLETDRE
jgi:hypothetical protein